MATPNNVITKEQGNGFIALQRNAQQEQKFIEESMKALNKLLVEKEKAVEKSERELNAKILALQAQNNQAGIEEAKRAHEEVVAAKKAFDEEYAAAEQEAKIKAVDFAATYELNVYKQMNAQEKRIYQQKNIEELSERKKLSDRQLKNYEEQLAAEVDAAKKARIQKDIDKELEKNKQLTGGLRTAKAAATNFSASEKLVNFANRQTKIGDQKKEFAAEQVIQAERNLAKVRQKFQKDEDKHNKKQQKLQADLKKAKEAGDKDEMKRLKQLIKEEDKRYQEQLDNNEELKQAEKEVADAKKDQAKTEAKSGVGAAATAALNKVSDSLSSNMDAIYGEQGRMMGRLQGSGILWNLALLDVTTSVGVSGVVSQKDVVKKMVELVDSGVAYNLEMRAFLGEISENIASTFDAANGTLLRLVRIQQQDTTAARLGMEATLTNLFNKYFQDTSYLTSSGPADAISQILLDASATMDRDQSLEFEFAVQKWLGSLYSVGMSSEAVQKIAQGITYLGTGNVSALSGDSALQTLFAMSANRVTGGKSYADMLTQGIDASDTNKLLKAMIEYLAEIASKQDNNVTKAAYADLFGMSLTDFSLFTSLKKEEIASLSKTTTSYDKLMTEVQTQAWKTITRLSMAQLLDTVIDNAEVGAASLIGSNPVTYGMWKATAILKDYVGEIKIPGVTGMGTGIASGLDILNLAQTAMAGFGLLGSLVSGVASIMQGGALNLKQWNSKESTSRGSTLKLLDLGSSEDTSVSAVLGTGSGSGSDMETVTMESGKESAYESSETSQEEMDEQKELPQKIYDALAGDQTPTVLSTLLNIESLLTPERVFYTAITGALDKTSLSSKVTLSEEGVLKAQLSSTSELTSTSVGGAMGNGVTGEGIKTTEQMIQDALFKFFSENASGIKVEVTNMPMSSGSI